MLPLTGGTMSGDIHLANTNARITSDIEDANADTKSLYFKTSTTLNAAQNVETENLYIDNIYEQSGGSLLYSSLGSYPGFRLHDLLLSYNEASAASGLGLQINVSGTISAPGLETTIVKGPDTLTDPAPLQVFASRAQQGNHPGGNILLEPSQKTGSNPSHVDGVIQLGNQNIPIAVQLLGDLDLNTKQILFPTGTIADIYTDTTLLSGTIDHTMLPTIGTLQGYVDTEITLLSGYVDTQVTAQDLDFQGDTGGILNIDLDSETLLISGGTGITTSGAGNSLIVDIDNTIATKVYVDNQFAPDLSLQGDTGSAVIVDLLTETLLISGGTGITTSGAGNSLIVDIDNTIATVNYADTKLSLAGGSLTGDLIMNGDVDLLFLPALETSAKIQCDYNLSGVKHFRIIANNSHMSGTAVLELDADKLKLDGIIEGSSIKNENTFSSNSSDHLATQSSIKSYVDNTVAGAVTSEMSYKGGYNAATNTPDLDTSPISIAVGDMYTVTAAGLFFTELAEIGDVLIAEIVNASGVAD